MDLTPEAQEAIHKAKNAQQAVEVAREASNAKFIEDSNKGTQEAVFEAMEKIFGLDGMAQDPKEMRLILQRVPLLCTNVNAMHTVMDTLLTKVTSLEENQKYVIRLILGGVVSIIVAVIVAVILRK